MLKKIPISAYDHYCTGYQNPDNTGEGYVLGLCLEIGKVPVEFRHPGSDLLDRINAFDMAEASGTYLGQINMIQVSSFCGLQGAIWGYDIAKHEKLNRKSDLLITRLNDYTDEKVPVYSAAPLFEATRKLIGTRDKKRFPILPGSHVPCATKNISKFGPCHLYCALAIGIPEDRTQNAVLLMEDIGEINNGSGNARLLETNKQNIIIGVAKSILAVGKNQAIKYSEIYVQLTDLRVEGGEIGCALVAAPYLALAQNALPKKITTVEELHDISLQSWEKKIRKSFYSP